MSEAAKPFQLGLAILAAGASSRMGRPKLLLPWGNTSVIDHLLSQWKEIGVCHACIVCASSNQALSQELDRLRFPSDHRIVNDFPERGMFTSIQCAASWKGWEQTLTHFAISLGDQPLVRTQTLDQLLRFSMSQPESICQPRHNGRPRHPVIFPATSFRGLSQAPEENLRQHLAVQSNLAYCNIDDPGLDLDMDTPVDYERALTIARGEAPVSSCR